MEQTPCRRKMEKRVMLLLIRSVITGVEPYSLRAARIMLTCGGQILTPPPPPEISRTTGWISTQGTSFDAP